MNTLEKINELAVRRSLIDSGGKVDGHTKASDARCVINSIIDPGSFIEVGAFLKSESFKNAPADGVITGYGTVDGRLVYLYVQNGAVFGGSVGEKHATKICAVYEMALKVGAPVIGVMDSSGVRIDEEDGGLAALGIIFQAQVKASGVIPQISIINGKCMGGLAFSPALSDFVFMSGDHPKLFLSSSNICDNDVALDVGNVDIHSKVTGIADFYFRDNECTYSAVRKLLSFIPANNIDDPPCLGNDDDINRCDDSLNSLLPDDLAASYDIKQIISSISDKGDFFEIKKDFAPNVLIGFSKFNDYTVGIVANQPLEATALDICALQKASKFINFCDAFNIPILTLTDTDGFVASYSQEHNGIVSYSAKLLYSFAAATVPKVTLIVRKGFGSAYLLMNSKHIGADVVYCWPTAVISPMNPDAYVKTMFTDKIKAAKNPSAFITDKIAEYMKVNADPYAAAEKGYVDDIIVPSETRPRIIAAFEMLSTKRELKHAKKHSSIAF